MSHCKEHKEWDCVDCLKEELQTKDAEIKRLAKNLTETLEKNSELLLEQVRIGNRFEERVKAKDTRIKELEGEVERLKENSESVFKRDIKTLTAQIELLTRCNCDIARFVNEDQKVICQGCKNKALLEKEKGK